MAERHESLLGIGVYTIPEAARLTRVSARTIRRWTTGYRYTRGEIVQTAPAVWRRQIAPVEDTVALSFRDLIEVRFVAFFRERGVSWKTIRLAARSAAEIVQDSHPFSTKRFKTDGKSIFADIIQASGKESLLDLARQQYELKTVVEPFLYEGLEFSDLGIAPVRWWPLGKNRRVAIDPERSFGQPIVTPESVPTSVLAKAYRAEGTIDAVARWFMVPQKAVEDAVEFEKQLATAA